MEHRGGAAMTRLIIAAGTLRWRWLVKKQIRCHI
jgi:hypothetical protein